MAQVHTLLLQLGACSATLPSAITGKLAPHHIRLRALSTQPDRAAGGHTSVCSSWAFIEAIFLGVAMCHEELYLHKGPGCCPLTSLALFLIEMNEHVGVILSVSIVSQHVKVRGRQCITLMHIPGHHI